MPARRVLGARARQRDEDDRRLLPLELVDRPHAHAVGHTSVAARAPARCTARRRGSRLRPERARRLVVVRVRRPEKRARSRPRPRPPPPTRAGCSPRARPAGRRARPRPQRSAERSRRPALEPAFVVRLRRERASSGPQPPRPLEEDRRDPGGTVVVLAEQVLEDGLPSPPSGMRALRDLRQLVRVAEEDEVARDTSRPRSRRRARPGPPRPRTACREARRSPRARRARPCRRRAGGRSSSRSRPAVGSQSMNGPSKRDSVVAVRRLLPPAEGRTPCSRALRARSPRRSLWIALWLSEVTPTRLPLAHERDVPIFAPCHVLPEPGGPCTKR